jgi:hypothetical protein
MSLNSPKPRSRPSTQRGISCARPFGTVR